MGLRFDPIGGGKFKQFVQQLIEVERQPIHKLEERKANEKAKLQLFRDFKGKFSSLQSAVSSISDYKRLREFKVDLGDADDFISVTVDKDKAQPGSYQLEIEELAERASMITNGVSDPAEKNLGIGFVVVDVPNGDTFETFIDEDDASLNGIAAKINSLKEAPVRATVVQDAIDPNNKWRLVITAKKDGYYNGVTYPELYFLDGKKDLWLDDTIEAKNAALKIDGFEIETDGNTVPEFLTGVNINLKQARPGHPFQLKIDVDHKKVTEKVKDVVEKINGVLEFINLQNRVDEKSDTSKTFTGDTGLQSIEYRLRNLLHEGFYIGDTEDGDPRIMHLSEMGITIAKDGRVSLNEDKFTKVVEARFDDVGEAISGDFGFAYQLNEVLGGYTRPLDGLLSMRERGLQSRIDQIDKNIERTERVLEQRTQALTDKFSRLQGVLGNMQQQQAQLSATLGSQGGNLVSQLLG